MFDIRNILTIICLALETIKGTSITVRDGTSHLEERRSLGVHHYVVYMYREVTRELCLELGQTSMLAWYMLVATLSLLLSLPPIVFSICNPQSKHCIRIQSNVLQFYLAVYLLDDWHSLKHFIRCTHLGNWYLKVST